MVKTLTGGPAKQAVAWAAVAVCVLYAVFAFWVATDYVLVAVRGGVGQQDRSAPPLFVLHALSGGVALIAGSLQLRLASALLRRRRSAHRLIGRCYLWAAWIASAGSFGVAASFDVSAAARILMALGSVLWFATTTVGFAHIRNGRVREHREWMIRSFSLAFFFVTFSVWVPLFAGTSIPDAIGYPVAVLLSWSLNLATAEVWIRRVARRRLPPVVMIRA